MTEEHEVLRVRLYRGQDDDLIAWTQTLATLPYGAKGQAIKALLRRGLAQGLSSNGPAEQGSAGGNTADLLAEIRRVLEATLESTLSRLPVQGTGGQEVVVEQTVADEMEAILDSFAHSLLLSEEEGDSEK